ncbi:hypothetical protein BJ742DRAFT_805124 [Cladochytrium replicatum]|nr:hypothetical protein BJ742DRAFT_805124 [Cladochytrium replicatum]
MGSVRKPSRTGNILVDVQPSEGSDSCIDGFSGGGILFIHGRVILRNVHPTEQPVSFRGIRVSFHGTLTTRSEKGNSRRRTPLLVDPDSLSVQEEPFQVILVDEPTTLSASRSDTYSLPFEFTVPEEIASTLPPSMEILAGGSANPKAEVTYTIVATCWGIGDDDQTGEAVFPVLIERHHGPSLSLLQEYNTRNLEVNGDSAGIQFRIRAPKVIIPGSLYEVVYRFDKSRVKKRMMSGEDRLKRIEAILTEKVWIKSGDSTGQEQTVERKFPMTVEKERCQKTGWDAAARFSFRLPPWSGLGETYNGPLYIEHHHKLKDVIPGENLLTNLNPSGDWGGIRVGHSILFSVQYKSSGKKQHVFPITVLGATRRGLENNMTWAHLLDQQNKLDEQAVVELNGVMSEEDALNLAVLESFLDPLTQPQTDADEEKALSNALDQSALVAIFSGKPEDNQVVHAGELLTRKKEQQQLLRIMSASGANSGDQLMNAGFTEEEATVILMHASKHEQKVGERVADPFAEDYGLAPNSSASQAKKEEEKKKTARDLEMLFDFGDLNGGSSFNSPKSSLNDLQSASGNTAAKPETSIPPSVPSSSVPSLTTASIPESSVPTSSLSGFRAPTSMYSSTSSSFGGATAVSVPRSGSSSIPPSAMLNDPFSVYAASSASATSAGTTLGSNSVSGVWSGFGASDPFSAYASASAAATASPRLPHLTPNLTGGSVQSGLAGYDTNPFSRHLAGTALPTGIGGVPSSVSFPGLVGNPNLAGLGGMSSSASFPGLSGAPGMAVGWLPNAGMGVGTFGTPGFGATGVSTPPLGFNATGGSGFGVGSAVGTPRLPFGPVTGNMASPALNPAGMNPGLSTFGTVPMAQPGMPAGMGAYGSNPFLDPFSERR